MAKAIKVLALLLASAAISGCVVIETAAQAAIRRGRPHPRWRLSLILLGGSSGGYVSSPSSTSTCRSQTWGAERHSGGKRI